MRLYKEIKQVIQLLLGFGHDSIWLHESWMCVCVCVCVYLMRQRDDKMKTEVEQGRQIYKGQYTLWQGIPQKEQGRLASSHM